MAYVDQENKPAQEFFIATGWSLITTDKEIDSMLCFRHY